MFNVLSDSIAYSLRTEVQLFLIAIFVIKIIYDFSLARRRVPTMKPKRSFIFYHVTVICLGIFLSLSQIFNLYSSSFTTVSYTYVFTRISCTPIFNYKLLVSEHVFHYMSNRKDTL